ncbi:MAG: right-handed parallel beta-helix repeat-containing protein [Pirellulales bacterium]
MMSRCVVMTVVFLTVQTACCVLRADTVLYVSPQGNDGWSGRLAAPNAENSDGPLATLTGARDAVRRRKQEGDLKAPVRVLLRGGEYLIDTPILFGPEDSGTAEAPITYAAQKGEKPVISGGRTIRGWRKNEGPTWSVTVPQVKPGEWYFRQLFVDGRRAVPARTPNDGVFKPAGPLRPLGDRNAARRDPKTRLGFNYASDDLQAWPTLDDAVIVYYHAWTTSRHLIDKLDTEKREVHFRNPSGWPIYWWGDKERYYIEALREAIDTPGEFHLDRTTGVLTYYPRVGEDMNTARTVAPVAKDLLRLEGDPAAGQFVEYLRFEGLSFQHTSWTMPREGAVDGQAAAFLDTASVFARGARQCRFTRCDIAHTGGYGLWLENGCQHNVVEQCHLHDLGAGGVRLGQTSLPAEPPAQAERNQIVNCFIHEGGRVFHAGVGVWIGRSSHNHIAHNDICDFYYTGVSVGWSWGYAPSTAHHNVIEYNHIHHLGWRQLSDMGGIYCLGISPGTCLRYNRIHDVMSYPTGYGGWGLYTDEGSTGIVMENNLVYRTKDGGFHQHYGRDNVVRNNVLAFSCGRGQIVRTRVEPHRSFTFERNIIYYSEPPLLGGNWGGTDGFTLDHNLYWRVGGTSPEFPGGLNLEEWRKKGHDVNSIVADPKFVAADQYDFGLQDDSPALQLGFQPIDIGTAGLTGPKEWTRLAEQVERPPFVMPWEE